MKKIIALVLLTVLVAVSGYQWHKSNEADKTYEKNRDVAYKAYEAYYNKCNNSFYDDGCDVLKKKYEQEFTKFKKWTGASDEEIKKEITDAEQKMYYDAEDYGAEIEHDRVMAYETNVWHK